MSLALGLLQGQNKQSEDVFLAFLTAFWHLTEQTINKLIKKIIGSLINNEYNHELQIYTDLLLIFDIVKNPLTNRYIKGK